MASFAFTARDRAGRSQTGTLEAPSAAAAADQLRARGWLVIEVRAAAAAGMSLAEGLNPASWLPVREVDVAISLKQISVMLRSGLTILSALEVVALQARRRRLRIVWQQVRGDVAEGVTLADAMARHACFGHLVIQLVRVGEQTGALESVLQRAAAALEQRRALRTAMLQALAYPSFVLVLTVGVTFFIIFYLIPKIETFLTSLGRTLPPMTQLLIDVSNFAREYVLHGAVLGSSGLIALLLVYNWPPGRLVMDRLFLRIPVIGAVLRLSGTILFARAMELLLRSGITLIEGLRAVEVLLPNRYLGDRVAAARERVLEGSDLAEPLTARGAFEPMLPRMIAVGEESGTLEDVLAEVASFYEGELASLIKILGIIIEPLVIAIVGGIVGFVYISVFMALYSFA